MVESGSELNDDVSIEAEVVEEVVAVIDNKPLLDDIWQCKMIETFRELCMKKWCYMMRCRHRNESFIKGATKLTYHIGQIKGGDIKICDSTPPEYKAKYRHSIQQ